MVAHLWAGTGFLCHPKVECPCETAYVEIG